MYIKSFYGTIENRFIFYTTTFMQQIFIFTDKDITRVKLT